MLVADTAEGKEPSLSRWKMLDQIEMFEMTNLSSFRLFQLPKFDRSQLTFLKVLFCEPGDCTGCM